MEQIRIHGRGGQGVVTAAELIAIAAFKQGKNSQAFPHFGVERSGAPIKAFARISDGAILTREHVYEPTILIIQDQTLIDEAEVFQGLNKDVKIIINSQQTPEEILAGIKKNFSGKFFSLPNIKVKNIFPAPATAIAMEIFGKNIVNTVILGAFAKHAGIISLEALEAAIREKFSEKGEAIIQKNIAAIEKIYKI